MDFDGGFNLETLRVSVTDHVATVELNRPEVLNAINMAMYADIVNVMQEIDEHPGIHIVILRGYGRAFSVGADLKERETMSVADVQRRRRLAPVTFSAISKCSKPVIAAIHGYAFGGGWELALSCDVSIATTSTVFSLPETKLGLIPAGGGTQRMPRLVGPQIAKELIFTGRKIEAVQAAEYGVLNRVVADDDLDQSVEALVDEMRQCAPIALSQAKLAINAALDLDITSGFQFEAAAYEKCLHTEDRLEGLRAFREKRQPIFKGA